MAHDVFISYSSRDKTAADAVCALLEVRGIRCWIAPRDILPGVPWAEALIEAIEGAKVMVLVFSASANKSSQIQREVERAANRSMPIVPLRIEDTLPTKTMEYFISTPHWLDAIQPPLDQHIDRLADSVKQLLSRELDHVEGTGFLRNRPMSSTAVPAAGSTPSPAFSSVAVPAATPAAAQALPPFATPVAPAAPPAYAPSLAAPAPAGARPWLPWAIATVAALVLVATTAVATFYWSRQAVVSSAEDQAAPAAAPQADPSASDAVPGGPAPATPAAAAASPAAAPPTAPAPPAAAATPEPTETLPPATAKPATPEPKPAEGQAAPKPTAPASPAEAKPTPARAATAAPVMRGGVIVNVEHALGGGAIVVSVDGKEAWQAELGETLGSTAASGGRPTVERLTYLLEVPPGKHQLRVAIYEPGMVHRETGVVTAEVSDGAPTVLQVRLVGPNQDLELTVK